MDPFHARKRPAAALLAVLLAACLVPALAASGGEEQQRIQRERREADERYAEAIKACEGRFAITACIERARAERRAALDRLRLQQSVIDDAKRRQRAAQRLQEIEGRTTQADALGPEPASSAPSVPKPAPRAASSPPRTAKAPPAPSPVASRPPRHPGDDQTLAQRRQRRAAEAEQRRLNAEIHRREVERRNAERDRQHPPAAPLPVPGAASAVR